MSDPAPSAAGAPASFEAAAALAGTGRLLHEAFVATAARLPQKTALVCGALRLSYAELLAHAQEVAEELREQGVAPGDRVVLTLEADHRYVAAVHAVLLCGAVVVPLSPTTKLERLIFVLQDTEAAAWLGEARPLAEMHGEVTRHCPALQWAGSPAERRLAPPAAPGPPPNAGEGAVAGPLGAPPRIDQDLAALIYTSGSTGRPKGVMLTHHNMVSAWAMVQHYLHLTEHDVVGLALPPTFSYGLYHVLMALGHGATLVLERQAAFAQKVAQTLERERITVFPAVPTLLAALLALPNLDQFDHGALRLISNAAAALPVPLVPRVRAAWPAARFYSMYGMTECKRISYLPPEELERHPGSVGRGLVGQAHWLVDETGRPLPPGRTGELVVRGSHVMRGYWRRPEETAARLRPLAVERGGGVALHTGDLFHMDAEGYLHFVARLDDIIKTRGEKVAPREVEEAIHQLPGVAACAVVGIADEQLGQAVKAFVTLAPGAALSARDIVRHCLARLESHMVPKHVEFVIELPVTESGKVRHASLREQAAPIPCPTAESP